MTTERVDTLIIGAGQAGLAMSHMLTRSGCSHVVVERHRLAERWRTERWDGLRFQFPNWSVRLPDFPFPCDDPDAFATTSQILDFICAYADFVKAPVRSGVTVAALRRLDGRSGFAAHTAQGAIEANNVVVATGPYQRALLPPAMKDVAGVHQVHASQYTNSGDLPAGAVLVVGSGASGAQIAEELCREGRRVFLSVGRHRRMPRRYRGRDLIWWLSELGLDQTTVEKRGPERTLPLITGAYGGHTIDFRDFAARGITLLGHLKAASGGAMEFAPDLAASITAGDASYLAFLDLVDAHVERHGLDMPPEPGRTGAKARSALRHNAACAACARRRRHFVDHLGDRLCGRLRLDRYPGVRCSGRADPSQRHHGGAGSLFPWAAVAFPDELVVHVRGG
jgi:putative flavoprotein involved in K+ transport